MTIANTASKTIIEAGIIEDNDQTQARIAHLKELENLVGNVYPNKFERSTVSGAEDTVSNILHFEPIKKISGAMKSIIAALQAGEKLSPALKSPLNAELKNLGSVRVSGRLATPPRTMGKAAFVHLSDGVNRLQVYCRKLDFVLLKNEVSAAAELAPLDSWTAFGLLDHGDFIGVEGFLFLTNTGELSVHVEKLQFLSKALLPMPDKIHGINDPELQRRFRYADLIASSLQVEHEGLTTREVFERRAKLISGMRRFLDERDFIEVETPMLTPKATGAAAKPFATHHNALDIPLYARIAPELYLKRLTVGGFEKVYELNRNFRNEGLSQRHNPEFTMLEFYCAYMDVNSMMDFCEEMLKESVMKATGGTLKVNYDGKEIDFSKFERISMKQAIAKHWSDDLRHLGNDEFNIEWLDNQSLLKSLYILPDLLRNKRNRYLNVNVFSTNEKLIDERTNEITIRTNLDNKNECWEKSKEFGNTDLSTVNSEDFEIEEAVFKFIVNRLSSHETEEAMKATIVNYLFESIVEPNLTQPTFIIDYPKSISPLSKASPENPNIAERFELFIAGMEVANGFSELNDPQEQYERFLDQAKDRESGDDEAMLLDEDYIRALAYGMPPAAGIGIGIDRLVMLLTNRHSIRDVILFPHLRPEKRDAETEN